MNLQSILSNFNNYFFHSIAPLTWVEIQCFALTCLLLAYMLTCVHACMLTCSLAYMFTCFHEYMLTCFPRSQSTWLMGR